MSRHLLSPRPPSRNTSKLSKGYIRSVARDMAFYAGGLRRGAQNTASTAKDALLFGLDVAVMEYHRRKRLRVAKLHGINPPEQPRK